MVVSDSRPLEVIQEMIRFSFFFFYYEFHTYYKCTYVCCYCIIGYHFYMYTNII